jgi:hypothetical protein
LLLAAEIATKGKIMQITNNGVNKPGPIRNKGTVMKKHLSIIVGIACSILTAKAAAPLSSGIYNPVTGHTYYLLGQDTWTGSEVAAESLGGALVTINDATENQWIYDTFSTYGNVNRLLWIGLNDPSHANPSEASSFAWVSGQATSYLNFAPYEPSAYTPDEFYVYMYSDGFNGVDIPRVPGTWNTYRNLSTEFGGGSAWPVTPIFGVAEVPEPSLLPLASLTGLLFLKRRLHFRSQ